MPETRRETGRRGVRSSNTESKNLPSIVQVLGSEEDLVGEPINDYNDFDL